MAELEAYSGDIAEQVMDGTLAETASLHSSSVSHSPRTRQAYAASQDELASSIADELDVQAAYRPPPRPREGDTNTGSGSHSHETVTVSDMPRSTQERALRTTTNTRNAAERTPTPQWQEPKPRRQAPKPRASMRAPQAPPSVQSKTSEGASRSFISAQPSLEAAGRSARGGPMGRYTPSSVGGRSSLGRAAPPVRRPAEKSETEQTLRAIQASLMALTERLDKAENNMSHTPARPDTAHALKATVAAASHALYDVGVLLGMVGHREARAPSYEAWRARGDTGRPAPSLWQLLLRAPLKFAASVASIAFRLVLDMTSLVLMASVLMALLRRVSGRGDPWIVLRLLTQASARLRFFQVAANRRAAVRALLASALVGGVVMESRNGGLTM